MTAAKAPCLVCGKSLENVFTFKDDGNQPSGATEFYTEGHYGSGFWDPARRDIELVINICDPCMMERSDRCIVRHSNIVVEESYETLTEFENPDT